MSESTAARCWSTLQEAVELLFAAVAHDYGPAFEQLAGSFGLSRRELSHFAYVVENFDPLHLSPEAYRRRSPYDHPASVIVFLEAWRAAGLVQIIGPATYALTEAGRQVCFSRWELANRLLGALRPLTAGESARLLALLTRLQQALAEVPLPQSCRALRTRLTYGLKASKPADLLWRLQEARMDVQAFRDDAHLASWRDRYPVAGHVWETLSLLWAGLADDPVEIARRLAYRGVGYTVADYRAALETLVAAGWAQRAEAGGYVISEAGRAVREQAEKETDELFYAPWSTLSAAELEELLRLLCDIVAAVTN